MSYLKDQQMSQLDIFAINILQGLIARSGAYQGIELQAYSLAHSMLQAKEVAEAEIAKAKTAKLVKKDTENAA